MTFGASAGLGGVTSVGLTLRETRRAGAAVGVGDGSFTAAGCALPDCLSETFGSARGGAATAT